MGVAVSTPTDVAKSAAGIVLTTAGLGGIVFAVKEGRSAFQRILTYMLNSVTKKIVNVLFLAIGLIVTGHAVLTPLLMVIIMIAGDFLGMSVTADNVRPSAKPNQWQIGKLVLACSILGICLLGFCTGSLLVGKYQLGLDVGALQTLAAIALVFGGEATLYAIRERQHLWNSRPGTWLIVSSIGDIVIIPVLMTVQTILRNRASKPFDKALRSSSLGKWDSERSLTWTTRMEFACCSITAMWHTCGLRGTPTNCASMP